MSYICRPHFLALFPFFDFICCCCEISSWDPNAAWEDQQTNRAQTSVSVSRNTGAYPPTTTDSWDPNASWDQGQQNYAYSAATGDQSEQSGIAAAEGDQSDRVQSKQVGSAPAPEFYKSKDPKASQILVDPLLPPAEGGPIALITWRVCYPIHYLCQQTMPDCRTEKYRNWYGLTFVMSMVWISFYSYLMVSHNQFTPQLFILCEIQYNL